MKKIYTIMAALFASAWGANAQTTVLSYQQTNTATASDYLDSGLEMTVNYLSTCQQSVSATFNCANYGNGVWSGGPFDYYVNGNLVGSSTGIQTIDLSSYIPVNSIRIVKTAVANWNEVHMTVSVGTTDGSAPDAPVVSNVAYCQNAVSTPLAVNLTDSAVGLKWYTSDVGSGFATAAPTPSTATLGTTTYWVAQADASGCESERSEIEVTIVANPDSAITREGDVLSVAQADATYQWGTCENGNFTAIAGATSQDFTATEVGSYAVEVALGDCSETSACFDVSSLSAAAFEHVKVQIYPNPTTGLLTIELARANDAEAVLFDTNGRQLMRADLSESSSGMDLSKLANGVYLLQIKSAEAVEVKRVVKK